MELGKIQELRIERFTSVGAFLSDDEGKEVLLPNNSIPEGVEEGDVLEVFLYADSEDRVIATTEKPKVVVGDIAYLEVVDDTPIGAFLDWGLPKDLFVPPKSQDVKMRQGEKYFVTIYEDEFSNRICGTSKISFLINNKNLTVKEGDEVNIIVYSEVSLGYKVIINKCHWGIIYSNQVFQKINIGDELNAFVHKVRPDNKIDCRLQKIGRDQVDESAVDILDLLKERGGFLPLNDKSSPEEIYKLVKMSKKNYKKTIGSLYKQRLITLGDDGIYLIENKK